MSDQDSSKMRVSERNETCFNCRTEAVSHLQNAKTQKHKNAKGAKSISQLTKKNAYILQRKKEEGESVHRDCASPAFSISYGQAKEMATHNGSHLSNVLSFSFNIGWWQYFSGNLGKYFLPLHNPWGWKCSWDWSNQRKKLSPISVILLYYFVVSLHISNFVAIYKF